MTAPEQLKSRIRGWLLAAGWTIEERSVQPPGIPWVLDCRFGTPPVSVFQQAVDLLIVQATVRLTQAQKNVWASKPEPERNGFIWDLRFRLLGARAEFEVVGESEGELKAIRLMERIYEDGLTKDRFFQRIRTVRNAAILCEYLLAFGAGEPYPLVSDEAN